LYPRFTGITNPKEGTLDAILGEFFFIDGDSEEITCSQTKKFFTPPAKEAQFFEKRWGFHFFG
jgi:hypothetical protein